MKQYVQESYNLYIDGQWVPSSDGKTFKEYNPSNGEFLAEVSEATREDVDKAVKAATKALESWKHTSPAERQNLLLKIADIIDANADHLAMVETLDNGKTLTRNQGCRHRLRCRSLPLFRRRCPHGRRPGYDD